MNTFRKTIHYFFIACGFLLVILLVFIFQNQTKNKNIVNQNQNPAPNAPAQNNPSNTSTLSVPDSSNTQVPLPGVPSSGFVAPISRAGERVTKKPFGTYITPQNSPVSPERFMGYHTGTDFETFPEELNQDVSINAICAGKIKVKEWASGYGGVLVESCSYNNQPITVIYGHLNIASILKKVGDSLDAREKFAILGNAYSQQTDGERKHLHLGVHKGSATNILGYVQAQSQLSGWYNACDLGVCQ